MKANLRLRFVKCHDNESQDRQAQRTAGGNAAENPQIFEWMK